MQVSEFIEDYRDIHKGEKCLVTTCGPSLNDIGEDRLKELSKEYVCVAVKQSWLKCPEVFKYHFWNCCNLPLPSLHGHYSYKDHRPFVIASSNYEKGVMWHPNQIYDVFFKIPMYRNLKQHTVCGRRDFGRWMLSKSEERPCGPGIMYETVLYSLIHMGFKEIVAVGWDLSNAKKQVHFYKDRVHRRGSHVSPEIYLTIDASKEMYEWLENIGVSLKLMSTQSVMYEGIPRI